MIYLRDIKTNEVFSFETLKEVNEFTGLVDVRLRFIEKNRILVNKYITGTSLDSVMKAEPPKHNVRDFYIYDIVEKTITKETLTRRELCNKYGVSEYNMSDYIFKGFLFKKRWGFSLQDDKMVFYLSKIKKPKERIKKVKVPKVKKVKVKKEPKPKFIPTFALFDLEKNTQVKLTMLVKELAEKLEMSQPHLSMSMSHKRIFKGKLAVSRNEEDFNYFKQLYKEKQMKKDALIRKPKPDLMKNGELKKNKPVNTRIVRLSNKRGVEAIRTILNIK